MVSILPNISTLAQYLRELKDQNLNLFESLCCPYCGYQGLWKHGYYHRKADRAKGELNPVPIQRFFCPKCQKTSSALPECIPPRRWYLWGVQQAALLLHLLGQSMRALSRALSLSRHTVGRWLTRLHEQFLVHGSVLRNHQPELGRVSGFSDFWKACLDLFSLASAMRLCHVAGVSIP